MTVRVVRWLRTAAAVLATILAVVLAYESDFFDPVPYADVEMAESPRFTENGRLFIHYTYRVTAAPCEYETGLPFAIFFDGEREPLTFQPIRAPGQTDQRFEGPQHLRWLIDLGSLRPDAIQIWTRHDCGGAFVERMMSEFEVPAN